MNDDRDHFAECFGRPIVLLIEFGRRHTAMPMIRLMTNASCSGGGGVITGSWIFETVNNTPARSTPAGPVPSGPIPGPHRAKAADTHLRFLPDLLHLNRPDAG